MKNADSTLWLVLEERVTQIRTSNLNSYWLEMASLICFSSAIKLWKYLLLSLEGHSPCQVSRLEHEQLGPAREQPASSQGTLLFQSARGPHSWRAEAHSSALRGRKSGEVGLRVSDPGQLLTSCMNSRKLTISVYTWRPSDWERNQAITSEDFFLALKSAISTLHLYVDFLLNHFCRFDFSIIYPFLKIRVLLVFLVLLPPHPCPRGS